MGRILTMVAAAGMAGAAHADIFINELQGNTPSTDWEFIELFNSGPDPVDIGGWQVELWDSDTDNIGGGDGASPYVIPENTMIGAGGYFTFANELAQNGYGFVADQKFANNAIENSSFTIILADGPLLGSSVVDSILVIDSNKDAGNANRMGELITPGGIVGPDGDFMPGGFYRVGDGNDALAIMEFAIPAPSATPGAANIPAPAAGLALLALGAGAARRRR